MLKHRTETYRSFIYLFYYNLPENIRSQTKFSSFKNLSFRHFMSHAWPYFRHLTDNSFAVSHLIQLPLLNSITPFCFILFFIFLSHHGKHSKEWCCLTIKVYIKLKTVEVEVFWDRCSNMSEFENCEQYIEHLLLCYRYWYFAENCFSSTENYLC